MTLTLLITMAPACDAKRTGSDEIQVPSGSQLTSFVWKTVTFSTKLPVPYHMAHLSAELGNDDHLTSLVLKTDKKRAAYRVPADLLKAIPSPQLHTFHLLHSTLPATDELWHIQLNFKYGMRSMMHAATL